MAQAEGIGSLLHPSLPVQEQSHYLKFADDMFKTAKRSNFLTAELNCDSLCLRMQCGLKACERNKWTGICGWGNCRRIWWLPWKSPGESSLPPIFNPHIACCWSEILIPGLPCPVREISLEPAHRSLISLYWVLSIYCSGVFNRPPQGSW